MWARSLRKPWGGVWLLLLGHQSGAWHCGRDAPPPAAHCPLRFWTPFVCRGAQLAVPAVRNRFVYLWWVGLGVGS